MARPGEDGRARCEWCLGSPLEQAYHDAEWGVPLREERGLFELITLEGAQAGLSWKTILNKREGYRAAFAAFDPEAVAAFGARDRKRLLADAGIVRHAGKIDSTIENARALLALREEPGGLAGVVWSVVGGAPRRNGWRQLKDIPASTPESKALSKALRKRGFRFVGPTTCYALMQAAGLVNDHLVGCFRRDEV